MITISVYILVKYCAIKVIPKNTSKVIEQLNAYFPMEENRYLKRIRKIKNEEHVIALVCKNLTENDDFLQIKSKLDEVSIPFEDILSVNVPSRFPVTKKQYECWNLIWPLVFHESMDEKIKLKQFTEHSLLFEKWKSYFLENKLSLLIVESHDENELINDMIIYESNVRPMICDQHITGYPFDHLVIHSLSGELKNKRITRKEKIPYLLSGCIAILEYEPCTLCSMALLHSRIDAVIYFNPSSRSGALGSVCFLHSMDSLNHHFPVYLVVDNK